MLADNPAIATIPVRDAAKAKAFYRDKLGLEPVDEEPGVTTYKSGGSQVFVYESEYAGTNEATAATWPVDDVEAAVRELKSKGVAFEHYENMPGMRVEGDVHVGENMKAAWFKDPDGNILSLVSG